MGKHTHDFQVENRSAEQFDRLRRQLQREREYSAKLRQQINTPQIIRVSPATAEEG